MISLHAKDGIVEAAMEGNLEKIKRLVEGGSGKSKPADIVNSFDAGFTALHLAACCGHIEVVDYLLGHGARINQPEAWGHRNTALHMACTEGHVGVVQLLLDRGADPSIRDSHGMTPLMVASADERVKVILCLLDHPMVKASLDSKDPRRGRTALYMACLHCNPGAIRVLLAAGANPTIQDMKGVTPMAIAKKQGQRDCSLLLQVRVVLIRGHCAFMGIPFE